MSLSKSSALLAFGIVLFGALASGGVEAQNYPADKWTLKPLVPPFVPMPQNSQLNGGTANSMSSAPYTNAPIQLPSQSQAPPAPGLRLTIPTQQQQY